MKSFLPKPAIIAAILLFSYTTKAQTAQAFHPLPDDFDPKTNTLLVQKITWSKTEQKALENYLKKNYPFKYKLIDEKDIAAPAGTYANTKMYGFVLLNKATTKTPAVKQSAAQSSRDQKIFVLHFYDRNGRIHYPAFDGSSLNSVLKKVIDQLVEKFK